MKQLIFIALIVVIPIAAYALDASNERIAAAGDYEPGTGLDDQFGRMAAAGDYLPGGDPGGGVSTGTDRGNFVVIIRRLLLK
jgi:hypothetical protein